MSILKLSLKVPKAWWMELICSRLEWRTPASSARSAIAPSKKERGVWFEEVAPERAEREPLEILRRGVVGRDLDILLIDREVLVLLFRMRKCRSTFVSCPLSSTKRINFKTIFIDFQTEDECRSNQFRKYKSDRIKARQSQSQFWIHSKEKEMATHWIQSTTTTQSSQGGLQNARGIGSSGNRSGCWFGN